MEKSLEKNPEMKKMVTGLALGVGVLAIVVFAGFKYSQRYGGKITLPGGKTYVGETVDNPPTAPQLFTAGPEVPWVKYEGKTFGYSFSYPETLQLGVFPNDPADSVAIQWGNIPPERNLLLNIETVSKRDSDLVGDAEAFARNWHNFFSGLKGVQSVEKFTNTSGLTGYRALYINSLDQTPNVDVFFEIPGDPEHIIHIANGILDPVIFDRLVDSVGYQEAAVEQPVEEEAATE